MRNKAGLNPADALDARALRYFSTQGSIEQAAQAVRDWKGCIIGLFVSSAGWKDKTTPRPPKGTEL